MSYTNIWMDFWCNLEKVFEMNRVINPFAWENDFPSVYGHTSISFLKNCPGFVQAKGGNMQAAMKVANICVKPERIMELRRKYPNALLIPVITKNKLPEAFALTIGLDIYTGVYKIETRSRKTLSAMERLIHKPIFDGNVIKGKSFIIVDDIVTQGGTISALRKYIIACGGHVSAVVALAFSANSQRIAPKEQDIAEIMNKFSPASINYTLRRFKIADDIWELTYSQIRYLIRFKNVENIILRAADAVNCIS